MNNIILEVLQFHASPHRVFEAFTHQRDARKWLSHNYEFERWKGGKWKMGVRKMVEGKPKTLAGAASGRSKGLFEFSQWTND